MNILCFDIGGTEIKSMLIGNELEIKLDNIKSRAKEDAKLIIEDVFEIINNIKKKYHIDGIGISTAGMVDSESGRIIYTNDNFTNYIGTDRVELIKKKFNLKTVVENDVKAAAMGEFSSGSFVGYDSAFALTIGTGIGGALILNGKLYRGSSGQAGEIGYMPMDGEMFENIASTTALIEKANKKYPSKNYKNGIDIFRAADNCEKEALELLDEMTYRLAYAISSIMLIVNPEVILVGGGISEQKEKLINPIKEKIKKIVPENIYNSTFITNTKLGNKSGLYGIYNIFLQKNGD